MRSTDSNYSHFKQLRFPSRYLRIQLKNNFLVFLQISSLPIVNDLFFIKIFIRIKVLLRKSFMEGFNNTHSIYFRKYGLIK